jgi:hypothetical protein
MSTTDILTTALSELAALRESDRLLTTAIKDKRAAFDSENADLLTAKSETAAKLAEHEAQVRAMALVVFEQTGEKKPVEGVSVVIRTTYTYDADAAMAWASEHMPQLVKRTLDAKAFDKIAAAGGYSGATKIETPAAQISTDLSAFLAIPEPTNGN